MTTETTALSDREALLTALARRDPFTRYPTATLATALDRLCDARPIACVVLQCRVVRGRPVASVAGRIGARLPATVRLERDAHNRLRSLCKRIQRTDSISRPRH